MIWVYKSPKFGGLNILMKGGRMIKMRHKMGLKSILAYKRLGVK